MLNHYQASHPDMLRGTLQSEDIPSLLEFSIDVNDSVALCGRDKENVVDMHNTLEGPLVLTGCSTGDDVVV